MWQEIIVGICVIAAAAFVIRQWFFPPKNSCGGCNSCDKNAGSNCRNEDTSP